MSSARTEKIVITKLPSDSPAADLLMPMQEYDAQHYSWSLAPKIVVEEASWRIVRANRPAEELFGYDLGAMFGLSVHELVPFHLRTRHASHVEAFRSEPSSTARPMGQGLIVEGQHRRTGERFPVNVALYRLVHNGKRYVLAEITDMRSSPRSVPSAAVSGGRPVRLAGLLLAVSVAIIALGASLAAHRFTGEDRIVAKKKNEPPHRPDVAALEQTAQEAWSSGNAVRAERSANELTAADPENGLAFHVRGLCFEQSGRMEEALDQFSQAAKFGYGPSIVRLQRYSP